MLTCFATFLGEGNLDKAKAELSELKLLVANESLRDVTVWDINSVYDVIQIAEKVLKAEILSHEGDFENSMALLKEAVIVEDALNYNEPPDWFFSIRHHLGAVQIKAGQFNEAIETYQEDLKRLPKNGWAHHGLKFAYQGLNDAENVSQTEALIQKSWADADFEINSP